MNDYFVAKNGYGDWSLWRRTGNPDFPFEVLCKFGSAHEVWTLALRGAGVEDLS